MKNKSVSQQVSDGINTAIAWLLGMVWLGVVFAGLGIAFTPSQYSPVVGWILLVVAAAVLVLTVNKWAVVFPGLLAYATFNALRSISTGHALNNPQVKIGRIDAVIISVLMGASAFISIKFKKHNLTVPDRLAMFTFVFCIFWQAVVPRFMLLAFCVAASGLALAYIHDSMRRHNLKAKKSGVNSGTE